MNIYDARKALVDLGFINGYFFSRPFYIDDDVWAETLSNCFISFEDVVIKGSLLEADPQEADYRRLLHDLGFIRGWAWLKEIPEAVSDSITRVIDYFSDALPVTEIVFAPPQPIKRAVATTSEPNTCELAPAVVEEPPAELAAAATQSPAVEAPVAEPASLASDEPYLPEVPVLRREGVPLTKAPAEKPQRGRAPKIAEADLPVVEEMVRAGNSADMIAGRFECSAMTVDRYLKAHGLKLTHQPAVQEPAEEGDDPPADEPDEALVISTSTRLDFTPLAPDDWSDIQGLIASSRSQEAIASDYDVPLKHLDEYIAERLREAQERRSAKGAASGEA